MYPQEEKDKKFFKTFEQERKDLEDSLDNERSVNVATQEQKSEDVLEDETPYDFRAEYKDRITSDLSQNQEDVEKSFKAVRWHLIGIGVLIGVLMAILVSVLFFASEDDDLAPVTISENDEPVKERPIDEGGMDIPNQDKTVYKRMRTDRIDTKVERLFPVSQEPVMPQTREERRLPTKEGQILGTPMPESTEDIELEVLSLKEKAMSVQAAPKPPMPVSVATEEPVEAQMKPVKVSMPNSMAESEKKPIATAVPTTPKAAPVKKMPQKTAAKDEDVWRVQLISLPSKAGVQKAWPRILKSHSVLLAKLPQDIKEVVLPKGTYYRLRVGAFTQKKDAQDLCRKLKARKQDCTLTK